MKSIGSHIGRSNSMHLDYWGVLFPYMIVGVLWITSPILNNPTAFVYRESSQYNFLGSRIWRPSSSQNNWLQTYGPRNERMLDPVFILRSVLAYLYVSQSANPCAVLFRIRHENYCESTETKGLNVGPINHSQYLLSFLSE